MANVPANHSQLATKANIMFVIGSLDRGGAEGHLVRLSIALRKVGHNVSIFCLTAAGELAERAERQGVNIIAPSPVRVSGNILLRAFRSLRALFKLWRSCVFRRPQIVHTFLPEAAIFGGIAAFLAGTPIRIAERRSLNNFQHRRPYLGRLESWLLANAFHAVIGNSNAIIEQLRDEGVEDDRLVLIHNGIEVTSKGNPTNNDQSRVAGELVFVKIANLIPYKGHEDLLKALALFNKEYQGTWRIHMLGSDSGILADLKVLAAQLGISERVYWKGSVEDVSGYLKNADIAVCASHEEGFSNAILESMANKLPVVCTDVGGNSEAIVHRESGLIVPPREPEQMATALLELAKDKPQRERMGANAGARISTQFSFELCAKKYLMVIEALLEGRKLKDLRDARYIPITNIKIE